MHVDARKVLINADIALYRAKSQGRNRYEFFNHNLQADIINNKRTGRRDPRPASRTTSSPPGISRSSARAR